MVYSLNLNYQHQHKIHDKKANGQVSYNLRVESQIARILRLHSNNIITTLRQFCELTPLCELHRH